MASSFEKSVKGATKIKLAPPKTKYIEHILVATHAGEAGVGEVFRALQYRLRDSTWTVVFKSLITVHLMIREGSPDVTLGYLAKHRNMLAISMFSDAQTQGRNIRHYANYLTERARAFRETKCDWVRAKETRLEKLSVEKGLLRETEVVQHQLTALLKCDVLENELENEITITVFRLLVLDLLALFQVLNQAMINILGHFFEMSKVDAERAMDIYRNFTKQTDFVVQYLSVARQYEHHTRVEVPKLKHAPVNLGRQLEDYLTDPDFEIHRRQYLAELEAKKRGGGAKPSKSEMAKSGASSSSKAFPDVPAPHSASKPAQPAKGPDPDLIDFFDSIEQNQTTMATQPNPQQQQQQVAASPWVPNNMFQAQPTGQFQNGFVAQPTGYNPFQQQQQQQQPAPPQPLQPSFTGAGFGGFTPQPSFQPGSLASIPQNTVASFQTGPAVAPPPQQQLQTLPVQQLQPLQTGSTNPFRQSMMMTGQPAVASPIQQQSTNPFARSSPQAAQPFGAPANNGSSPFQSAPPQAQPFGQPQAAAAAAAPAPLLPSATGTNPFAKNFTGSQQQQQQAAQRPQTSAGLLAQPTGSTNPFRQSAFINHNTGMGWQHGQQPIGGGLDQLNSVPVFPRPAQQSPWQ